MSSNFVRYSPEVETFDPKLSEYMTRIIEFREKKVRAPPETEGSGRATSRPGRVAAGAKMGSPYRPTAGYITVLFGSRFGSYQGDTRALPATRIAI